MPNVTDKRAESTEEISTGGVILSMEQRSYIAAERWEFSLRLLKLKACIGRLQRDLD